MPEHIGIDFPKPCLFANSFKLFPDAEDRFPIPAEYKPACEVFPCLLEYLDSLLTEGNDAFLIVFDWVLWFAPYIEDLVLKVNILPL